jgi:hypothetical protein
MRTRCGRFGLAALAVCLQVSVVPASAEDRAKEMGPPAPSVAERAAAAMHTDMTRAAPKAEAPPSQNFAVADSSWKRLQDFRSRGNVRVLTLWQSKRFTLALQSGRNGTAGLQLSSKTFSRGDAKRGLLDELVHHTGDR